MELKSHTKANVLSFLKPKLEHSFIEDMYIFNVQKWFDDREAVLNNIIEKFSEQRVVVRSSALAEDGVQVSEAGKFKSVLNVGTTEAEIGEAVEQVIDSYKRHGHNNQNNQILLQKHTESVHISGVVFTRQIETNSPYYVVNYDDESGKTDTITGGLNGRVLYISHYNSFSLGPVWTLLLNSVKEIEKLMPGLILDIEFGITQDSRMVIFQVRPLAANHQVPLPDEGLMKNVIMGMASKFLRYNQRVPHLSGKNTAFGDMPDWNPSEIIGNRPNTLDYSLYSFLIMDEVWHEARTSLGYYDVFPSELMISFGRKPYIDVRVSFNSMVPASVSDPLREKLVSFYLEKLLKNPAFQDKVEFKILWTCYDFSTPEQVAELAESGFTQEEIDEFVIALHRLTDAILKQYPDILDEDLRLIRLLNHNYRRILRSYNENEKTPWNAITAAYNILQNCKRYGTIPFSRQARIAFIAKRFLYSLIEKQLITEEQYHGFLNEISTVATNLKQDFGLLSINKLSERKFLERYGHLRSGTYDITALRYDAFPDLFKGELNTDSSIPLGLENSIPTSTLSQVDDMMQFHRLNGDSNHLIDFIKLSIENREYAKFEFTKSLSDALELIAGAGKMLGFDRSDMSQVDWPTLYKFRNPEFMDLDYARKIIGQSIDRHRRERKMYDAVILPPVIFSEKDFYVVSPYRALPNFITKKAVAGELILLDTMNVSKNSQIEGRIVLLKNADPGYDWIFTKNPLAIITQYGGVASHMAIRCAEFGIPAAIGCGEVIFSELKKSTRVILDCERKLIKPQIME